MSARITRAAQIALLNILWLGATHLHSAAQTIAPVPLENPAAPAQALKHGLGGLPNFGRVTDTLYRGGQPTQEGFQALKKLGVEIVVNLRHERSEIEAERRQIEALGLRYLSIPWSASHNPTSQQVAEFLALLRANSEKKVFVHCHYGADRTGVMVAVFRIAMQNWTSWQAITEMSAFHYHHFWLPHLRRYVQNLPDRLVAEPALRGVPPVPVPTPAAHTSAPNAQP